MYDDLGQLIREDNAVTGKTYVYTYDDAGNILQKITYNLTSSDDDPANPISTYYYGYSNANWGDQLTSYRGEIITYDEIGNPTSYYNGTRWTFEWSNGRRLTSAEGNEYELSFTYNDEGIRTSKTVDASTHFYSLNGSQIITEKWDSHMLVYLYDADGSPMGMRYRNKDYSLHQYDTFWFDKNLQGDIVAVYNAEGAKLISYTYDAWGNFTTTYHNGCTASSTAAKNPFRYRGYYYDVDLGMYYLQSRYYDPVIGRFVSLDSIVAGIGSEILGNNMFAYAFNNPINLVDYGGNWPQWLTAVGEWISNAFSFTMNWGSEKHTKTSDTFRGPSIISEMDLGAYSSTTTSSLGYFTGMLRGQYSSDIDFQGGKAAVDLYTKASLINVNVENKLNIFGTTLFHKEVLDVGTANGNIGAQLYPTLDVNAGANIATGSLRGTYGITVNGWTIEFGLNMYYHGYGKNIGKEGWNIKGKNGFSFAPIIRITPP